MQLYYHPWACSLAVVIAASEAGIALELTHVDIMATPHVLKDGSGYAAINPKLYVPALRLADGSLLTELSVILQYLADLAPAAGLAPAPASPERYRLQEVLNFIATELHKAWSPWLFHPEVGEPAQEYARTAIRSRLSMFDQWLSRRSFAFGDTFTIADAYLFTLVGWAKLTGIELSIFPSLVDWQQRIAERPGVQAALKLHA